MKRLLVLIFSCVGLFTFAQKGESIFKEYDFSTLDTSSKETMKKFHGCISALTLGTGRSYEFDAQEIGHINARPFIAYSAQWMDGTSSENSTIVEISFSKDGVSWSPFEVMPLDDHYEGPKGTHVSQLQFTDKDNRYYKLKITTNFSNSGYFIKSLKLNFFNPYGEYKATANNESLAPVQALATNDIYNIGTSAIVFNGTQNLNSNERNITACPCPLPNFITRPQWNCPQGAGLVSGVSTSPSVSHLIVHHSAGSNTSADWNAVVLSIWNFHTGTNGYSDIGYNWLIAPNGQLYEGRGSNSLTQNVNGAHFCGTNAATMGVCMLGTYTNVDITTDARNTLIKLLAWKCCQAGIPANGTALHASSGLTLNRISGHRDGCSTECPGNTFYPTLPALRNAVQGSIDTCGGLAPCTPSVKLQVSGCPSTSLTFTPINVTNGGSAPTFTWFLNNIQVATGPTYSYISATNGDKIYARMTSNASCASPTQVNSDTITVTCVATTAIAQIDGVEFINISPNPTLNGQAILTMKLPSPKQVRLRILNANGATIWYSHKEIWSGTVLRSLKLPSTNTKGVYFVEVRVNGKKATYKLVVQ